jgi:CheY-like chemotaxis protein
VLEPQKFLVVDFNADSGLLLVRTLVRKFPAAAVQLCGDVSTVTNLVATEHFSAIVLHRTEELTGVELIQTIRALSKDVPIVAVSGIDRSEVSRAAGADAFLLYDEWLRVGTLVTELLRQIEGTQTGTQTGTQRAVVEGENGSQRVAAVRVG